MAKEIKSVPIVDEAPRKEVASALQTIPFEELIGGPLKACVKAQEMAAETTWRYIQEVGFSAPLDDKSNPEAVTVKFVFQQDGVKKQITIPLLAVVPIPYLTINTIDLSFKADLSATSEGELRAKFSSAKDSEASQSSKYHIQNLIDINIRASADSMPGGMAKILDIFSNSCIHTELIDDGPSAEEIAAQIISESEKRASEIRLQAQKDAQAMLEKTRKELEELKKQAEESAPSYGEQVEDEITRRIKGEYIHSLLRGIIKFHEVDRYKVSLVNNLSNSNKARVVAAILSASGNPSLTEAEVLQRAGSVNKTVITGVTLAKAKDLIKVIKSAGGSARYTKI